MCTSSARDSSPVHAATVASSPTSTSGSTYPPARCVTSMSAKSSPGPATKPGLDAVAQRSSPLAQRAFGVAPRAHRGVHRHRPPGEWGQQPPRHVVEHGSRHDDDRLERLGDDRREDDLGELVGKGVEHLRCRQARVLRTLGAVEPMERERHRLDPLVDVVDRPEVVQSSPAGDHRHGVQATVEPGVGEQLTIAELPERRRDLPVHVDPGRRVAAGRRARRRTSRSRRTWLRSASWRSAPETDASASVTSWPRSSASSRASSGSVGGRSSGVRAAITRVASMRASSSRGRPSAIAMRAPISVRALPCTAAWARVSIEPRAAWPAIAASSPRLIARRAAGRSPRRWAATASTWASRMRSAAGPLRIRRRVSAETGSTATASLDSARTRAATSRERVASATSPSASSRSATVVELVGDVSWGLVVACRGLQGEARGDRHPPVPALLAIPAARLVSGRPGSGVVTLGETDLGDRHSAPAISISLPSAVEHLEGPTHEHLGVVEAGRHRRAPGHGWREPAASIRGARQRCSRLPHARTRRSLAADHAAASPR